MRSQTKWYLLRPFTMFVSPAEKPRKVKDFDVIARTSLAFLHITQLIQTAESIDFWYPHSSKLKRHHGNRPGTI